MNNIFRKLSVDTLEDPVSGEVECISMPVAVGLIPFFRIFFEEMKEEGRWATQDDFIKARRYFGWQEAQLLCNNQMSAQLDTLTTLLSEWRVEQGDTLLAIQQLLDGLDTTSTSSLGVQNEIKGNNDQIACAIIGTLISLLSQGTITPTIAIGACSIIRAGGSGALNMLQDMITQGLGRNTVQALRGEVEPDPVDHILKALRGVGPAGDVRNLTDYVDDIETILGY